MELSHYVTIDDYNQVHRLTPQEILMLQYHSADRYRQGSYQAATGSSSSMALAGVWQSIVYPPPPPDESCHQSGDSGAMLLRLPHAKTGQHQFELVSPCHGQAQRQYGHQGYQCQDSQHCLDQGWHIPCQANPVRYDPRYRFTISSSTEGNTYGRGHTRIADQGPRPRPTPKKHLETRQPMCSQRSRRTI